MKRLFLRAFALTSFAAFLIAAGPALADGELKIDVRPGLNSDNASHHTIQVHRVNDDGTTTPVNDVDGNPIEIDPTDLGDSVIPASEEHPDGGRVTQTDKDARKGRVTVSLPDGNYRVVVVDDRGADRGFSSADVGVTTGSPREAKVTTFHGGMGQAIVNRSFPPPEDSSTQTAGEDSTAQAPQDNGASSLGTESTRQVNRGTGMASLTTSVSYGMADASVQQSGTPENDGADLDIFYLGLRPDIRFFFPDANTYNVANAANIANTGWGLDGCYYGLQGNLNVTRNWHEALATDQHPAAGVADTFLRSRVIGSLTPYLGCTVYRDMASGVFINLQGGPRFT